ncbi:MAG TPA: PspC domain-containing protein [Acidimicrobiales bacterium]|nr:PspC domain-containing protein [Acidimicrobiales bacterium]
MNAADDTYTGSQAPPPGAGPPGAPPPRLTRSTDDKIVSGLCGGLGRHFNVDPVVFRVAFVVLAVAGGSGVLLYLVGWLLVPDDRSRGTTVLDRARHGHSSQVLAAVLLAVGAIVVLDRLGDHGGGGRFGGLVLLAVGAAVLWSRRDHTGPSLPPPPAAPGPPPPWAPQPPRTLDASPAAAGHDPATAVDEASPTATTPLSGTAPVSGTAPLTGPSATTEATEASEASDASQATRPFDVTPAAGAGGGERTWSAASPTVGTVPVPAPPARACRPRSVLVAVTLSVLAILAGALALVTATGALDVPVTVGLALALLVVGGALLVGAWRGRARWLIPLGLILAVALPAAAAVDVPLRGGVGDRSYQPRSVAELRSPYRLAAGDLVVDLTGVDLSGTTRKVVASMGAGELEVVVPEATEVVVDGHVGAGSMVLFGRQTDGMDNGRHVVAPGREGGGRLVLSARTGFGRLEVRRASS